MSRINGRTVETHLNQGYYVVLGQPETGANKHWIVLNSDGEWMEYSHARIPGYSAFDMNGNTKFNRYEFSGKIRVFKTEPMNIPPRPPGYKKDALIRLMGTEMFEMIENGRAVCGNQEQRT